MKHLNEDQILVSMALFTMSLSVWKWRQTHGIDDPDEPVGYVGRSPLAEKTARIIAHDRILNDRMNSKGLPTHK